MAKKLQYFYVSEGIFEGPYPTLEEAEKVGLTNLEASVEYPGDEDDGQVYLLISDLKVRGESAGLKKIHEVKYA